DSIEDKEFLIVCFLGNGDIDDLALDVSGKDFMFSWLLLSSRKPSEAEITISSLCGSCSLFILIVELVLPSEEVFKGLYSGMLRCF
ncbi:hypothetical protein B9K06_25960, partial [Bacillus sp. OG2]